MEKQELVFVSFDAQIQIKVIIRVTQRQFMCKINQIMYIQKHFFLYKYTFYWWNLKLVNVCIIKRETQVFTSFKFNH